MDNVTHSLIGIGLARGAFRLLRRKKEGIIPSQDDRKLLKASIWASVLASNLPDIDFVLGPLTGAGNIGYLVQHRGFTHTFLFVPLCALLSALVVGWLARVERSKWSFLFAITAVASLFHIGADFWNEYGVHPFSPFWDRWFYGDFIFIVEPLLWFSMIPMAFQASESRALRIALGVLVAAILALVAFGPFTPWPVPLWLVLWLGLFAFLQKRWQGLEPAVAGVLLVLGTFAVASASARARVLEQMRLVAPREKVTSVTLSPAPGNPLCWRMIVTTLAEGEYRARLGTTSLWPAVSEPERCHAGEDAQRTVHFQIPSISGARDLHWEGEYRASREMFAKVYGENCRLRGAMEFYRVPFLSRRGADLIAGDIRYDREPGIGFSEVDLQAPDCPSRLPGWIPPAAWLLGQSSPP